MFHGIIHEILEQRQRQANKGYDAAHDDTHINAELAVAAQTLLFAAAHQIQGLAIDGIIEDAKTIWPFEPESLPIKPNPRDNLIASAALIVAEIARLDRCEKGRHIGGL